MCAVILQMGGWILSKGWLIKSRFMVENETYHLTETNASQKSMKFQELKKVVKKHKGQPENLETHRIKQ